MPSIHTLSLHSLLLGILFVLVACASAPVQEMSDARQAIQAAHAAGAERVARETLLSARFLLEKAEQELESGHYREARRNALGARAQAMLAREQAEQAPEEPQQGM
jgi:hypothetical protein